MGFIGRFRSFDLPSRVLMINQFGTNVGFFMLMPYLAGYLAGPLALAPWAVGLVLGVRNFSQQGCYVLGGTLADRLGYKPLIVAGCLLRTAGFGLLVVADSLPAVLAASAATGFAGALFNPAVRAYLAADAGDRRVEAFALFNVFYQAGILLGPLLGLALMTADFRHAAAAAALVFAVLTIAQFTALPRRAGAAEATGPLRDDWRTVTANRSFLLFAAAMTGCYVLTFQVYLALPLQAALLAPDHPSGLTAALFAVSGVVAVAGQLRITAWFSGRWGAARSLAVGMAIAAAAFAPLAAVPDGRRFGTAAAVAALLAAAALLAVAGAAMLPFEMDMIVTLAGGRLVATHYGFYNTIVGVGILLGNLGTGSLFGAAHRAGRDALVWVGLAAIGGGCALALSRLRTTGRLAAPVGYPTASAIAGSDSNSTSNSDSASAARRR